MRVQTVLGLLAIGIGCSISIISCEEIIPSAPNANELLDGPVSGLSQAEHARFLAGDAAFNNEIFTAESGLGPVFVATSCGSCHAGDGKGHPFSTLTRFGQSDETGNKFLDQGGPQLQHRAIPGYTPETIPAGAPFARFMPPANTGLGFLEMLTDAQILLNADPDDTTPPYGISGVPNYINPPPFFKPKPHHLDSAGKYIGRFGKKAAAIDLLHQTVNAYNQDIGIASTFIPYDVVTGLETDAEVSNQTVNNVVFYLQTLKAPIQRNKNDSEVILGGQTFEDIGCANCHIPEFTTPVSFISALSEKTFRPYTDLLLHDMGPGLDDGYTEGIAKKYEWRTPPLWGLGLAPNSQGGEYFLLHDGRAHSIEEAILLHGGEADSSKNLYLQLSVNKSNALIKFLKSL